MSLPLLPITLVGSWPRRKSLLRAQKAKRRGKLSPTEDCDRAKTAFNFGTDFE